MSATTVDSARGEKVFTSFVCRVLSLGATAADANRRCGGGLPEAFRGWRAEALDLVVVLRTLLG